MDKISKKERIYHTIGLDAGDITNKGKVDAIYDEKNLMIDADYYNLDRHKIFIIDESKEQDNG